MRLMYTARGPTQGAELSLNEILPTNDAKAMSLISFAMYLLHLATVECTPPCNLNIVTSQDSGPFRRGRGTNLGGGGAPRELCGLDGWAFQGHVGNGSLRGRAQGLHGAIRQRVYFREVWLGRGLRGDRGLGE